MNVEVLVWDPITGRLARPDRDWTRANRAPLSAEETQAMVDELAPLVDTYAGQGLGLRAVRITSG